MHVRQQGDRADARVAAEPLRIEDVLPTALALLGLPVPEGLDGRPALAPEEA
ncbi:MAG: hypothetical protein GYA73_02495 [Planctomycetes bacterium]|nr:hypothetical protein [Planctomycetota bacterium]